MRNAVYAPQTEKNNKQKRTPLLFLYEMQASYDKASPESKRKNKQIRTVENKINRIRKKALTSIRWFCIFAVRCFKGEKRRRETGKTARTQKDIAHSSLSCYFTRLVFFVI